MRALPASAMSASIQHLPMSGYNWTAQVYRGRTAAAARRDAADGGVAVHRLGLFETMRIPLRAGRLFTTARPRRTRPASRSSTKRSRGGSSARRRPPSGSDRQRQRARGTRTLEIVGVIGDVRFRSLDSPPTPELYRPLAQTFMFPMAFVVRTTGEPAAHRGGGPPGGVRRRSGHSGGGAAAAHHAHRRLAGPAAAAGLAADGVRGGRPRARHRRRLRCGRVPGAAAGARVRHPPGARRRRRGASARPCCARAPAMPPPASSSAFRRPSR